MFSFILMYHLYKYQIYKKYLIRLGIFAALTFLIMQLLQVAGVNTAGVPFNILYMFFVCVLALMLKKIVEDKIKNSLKKNLAVCLVYIFCGALVCRLSLFAFAYIILIYCFFEKPSKITFIMLLVFAYLVYLGGIEGIVANSYVCAITF